jgi:hypothetical protein
MMTLATTLQLSKSTGSVVAMHPGVHCSQVMCRLGLCHMTMLISICGRQSSTAFDPCIVTTSVCV